MSAALLPLAAAVHLRHDSIAGTSSEKNSSQILLSGVDAGEGRFSLNFVGMVVGHRDEDEHDHEHHPDMYKVGLGKSAISSTTLFREIEQAFCQEVELPDDYRTEGCDEGQSVCDDQPVCPGLFRFFVIQDQESGNRTNMEDHHTPAALGLQSGSKVYFENLVWAGVTTCPCNASETTGMK